MVTSKLNVAVVGTDTGVGKTVVTAGVVGWLRAAGYDARAVKPVQTGHPPDDDAGFVAAACGTHAAATCGPRLEPALAPAVAADVADRTLEYSAIRGTCETERDRDGPCVIEGIGGLRVPLADGQEVIDLVADLGVPAILVGRSGLGTLNHTALSVAALRRRGVAVAGVVLNQYEGSTTAERTNPEIIEDMTECPVYALSPVSMETPEDVVAGVREELPVEQLLQTVASAEADGNEVSRNPTEFES
nr:dethiobiotin synthase [Haloferax mucosum]